METRKRSRAQAAEGRDGDGEGAPAAACDHCRQRKVRCDRQQPECSNCMRYGVACNLSSSTKRVNHAKEL